MTVLKGLRRNKQLTGLVGGAAIALAVSLAALLAVDNIAFLTAGERFVEDLQIALKSRPAPQDSQILVMAVTEDTLRQFPYRAPLDRGFLAKLLTALDAKHPRAIGLDYLLDQPTEAAKDDALYKVLRAMKTPLVVSYLKDKASVNAQQLDYLDRYVPFKARAFANIATDQTDTVRWVYPGGKDSHGRYLMSFPRALAAKVGISTPAEQVAIAWHGHGAADTPAFSEIPAHVEGMAGMTMADILPQAAIENRIVLIGSDITLVDRHRTPFATDPQSDQGSMPGVIIQAHALSQLLDHRDAPEPPFGRNVLVTVLMGLIGAALGLATSHLGMRVLLLVGAIMLLWAGGIFLLFAQFGIMIALVAPTLAAGASFAAVESLAGLEARRQRAFVQGAFSRYVSPQVVAQMVDDPSRMALEGERRLMTFLFSDIQDFTTMSERLESGTLTALLNGYLNGMTEIVLAHDGMVDKFIGDAVMAIFNAPLDVPDHAQKAVRCMLALDDFTERFRLAQREQGVPLGITRIGVHTGSAVIGNFGSQARFTYTAQGDAVNTASRLEGINKYLGTRLCVSGETRELCPDMAFRPVATVVLKGKTHALELWEPLHDGAYGAAYLTAYGGAHDALRQRRPDAAQLFTALAVQAPDDPCVRLHLERIARGDPGVEMVMHEK